MTRMGRKKKEKMELPARCRLDVSVPPPRRYPTEARRSSSWHAIPRYWVCLNDHDALPPKAVHVCACKIRSGQILTCTRLWTFWADDLARPA